MPEDNNIFVGSKPFMNYVTGVVLQFQQKGASEVFVKARGKFISRAVDIAQVSVNRFLDNQVKIHDVSISSEDFTNDEGRPIRVSTIEISLRKVENPQ